MSNIYDGVLCEMHLLNITNLKRGTKKMRINWKIFSAKTLLAKFNKKFDRILLSSIPWKLWNDGNGASLPIGKRVDLYKRGHCVKVSKYGVISGLYFPTFGLNMERYEVFGHFSRSGSLKNCMFSYQWTVSYTIETSIVKEFII